LAPEGSYRRDGNQIVVDLPAVAALAEAGGAVRLALIGGEGDALRLVVVHAEGPIYRAYADCCTHNGRELDYVHEERQLQCRSRKSHFGLAGDLIQGPADGGLATYPLRVEEEQLHIEIASPASS